MKLGLVSALLASVLSVAQLSAPAVLETSTAKVAAFARAEATAAIGDALPAKGEPAKPAAEPIVVLTRSASWFVYPQGCDTVSDSFDLVIHFHGAHTTVIPRYLDSGVNALLVIINKGIGSGAYSDALAIGSQVDDLLARIETTAQEQCSRPQAKIGRVALSSWSAGYGATEQFLRLRPERVDAVLLADGLHVGFTDPRSRVVDADRLDVFTDFARSASRGEKLMAITHSAIRPLEYAGAGETAQVLCDAAHAPVWPASGDEFGMSRMTTSRRGQFYAEGFSGADKAAHASHLYAIGKTSFAHLAEYWRE